MIRVHGVVRPTADPELKTVGDKQVVNFRVATNGRSKDDSTFWNCTAWGHLAETIARYCPKGKQVAIDGVLRQRSYEKDNVKHTVDEIMVLDIELVGGAGGTNK